MGNGLCVWLNALTLLESLKKHCSVVQKIHRLEQVVEESLFRP